MAGHSQFKNIMYRKGRQDAARSKLFSKLAREITVAAKDGGPDPDGNPRLRLAIQTARGQSMPKDNIERAISKAIGGDGESYEEVRYEGYGPGGVAVIVEALTDNRNRSASNIRACFTKNGGQWLETIADSGADAVGLDWTTDIGNARARIGDRVALQGNMDPAMLYAPPERIRQEVADILRRFGSGNGHIFNLGHGITPDVDPEHAKAFIEAVVELSPEYHR